MTAAVLFDLGNTLAAYYHPSEFRPILAEAIGAVRDELTRRGLCKVSLESAIAAAVTENREAADYRVTPMTDRFERIFQVSIADDPSLAANTCERFLAPIFAIGRVYDDTAVLLWAPPPSEPARHTGNFGPWGGNSDFNELVEGTTVFLPVNVPGGLLYLGD